MSNAASNESFDDFLAGLSDEAKKSYLKELDKWLFIHQNRDLPLYHSNGLTIWFTQDAGEGLDDNDGEHERGRITMSLHIDNTTTIDQIREAWPLITQWRERLQSYQPNVGEWFRRYFNLHKNDGYSYKDLADAINAEIEQYIRDGSEQLKVRNFDHSSPTPIVCAAGLLTLMGIDDDEKRNWIISALENIKERRPLFPPDLPVSANRVRERLRKWPKTIKESGEVSTLLFDWQMRWIERLDEEEAGA
jgi:hypothetical protein